MTVFYKDRSEAIRDRNILAAKYEQEDHFTFVSEIDLETAVMTVDENSIWATTDGRFRLDLKPMTVSKITELRSMMEVPQ